MRRFLCFLLTWAILAFLVFPGTASAETTSEKARKHFEQVNKRYDALLGQFEDLSDKKILEELKGLKDDVLEGERAVEKVGFQPSRKDCKLKKVDDRKEEILKETDTIVRVLDGAIKFEEDVLDGKTLGGRPIMRDDVKDKVTPAKDPVDKALAHCIVNENEIKHHKDELKEFQKEWKERLDVLEDAQKSCAAYRKSYEEKKDDADDQKKKYEGLRNSKGPSHRETVDAMVKYQRDLGEVEKYRKMWEKEKDKVKRIEEGNRKFLTDVVKKETESDEPIDKQIEAWKEE